MVITPDTDLDEFQRIMDAIDASDWMFNEHGELVRKPVDQGTNKA